MGKNDNLRKSMQETEKRKNTVKKTGVTAFFLGPLPIFVFALFFRLSFIYYHHFFLLI